MKLVFPDKEYDSLDLKSQNMCSKFKFSKVKVTSFGNSDHDLISYIRFNKDSKDPAPFYIKASTLNYMQKYNEAVKSFQILTKGCMSLIINVNIFKLSTSSCD